MGTARKFRTRTPERTTPVVLLAALALLVQALLPAAAMAAAPRAGIPMVICTAMGVQTVIAPATGKSGKGFAGLPCQDCVAASIAAIATPEPLVLAAVAYASQRVEHAQGAALVLRGARAPPRPPSTAPPAA
ncbi:MAG: DUF2946 domain-containing protein [Phenylobacterium sp.]